jgi:hypothetical protein
VYNQCDTVVATSTLTVNPSPDAAFTVTPNPADVNTSVTFVAVADSASDIKWDFGDLSTDTVANPGHAYSLTGNYLVTHILENAFFCRDTAKLLIEVKTPGGSQSVLYVPSVFNPFAGNLENRTCKVYGGNISEQGFNFNVFNRWGEMVYSSGSFSQMNSQGWDGRDQNSGEKQQSGVYTYVLKGMYADGNAFEKTGTITIIQ